MKTQSSWESQKGNRRPARLVLPMLLIVVGVLFLLNNLGIVPWSVWPVLARLWPVILILLGVDLLLGHRAGALGAAITAVVLVAVVAFAIVLTYATVGTSGSGPTATRQQQSVTVPLGGASNGDVTVRVPAGTLNVGAVANSTGVLLESTASLPPGMHLSRRSTVDRGTAEVVLDATGDRSLSQVLPMGWPFGPSKPGSELTWDVRLAPTTPLSLRADVGAGQSDFDLTSLMVHQLTVNSGAGQTTIRFPAGAGQTTAEVQSGVGQLILIVPGGVGAYIHTPSGGLANVQVPSDRFQAVSDGYQTPNYQTAKNRIDLTLHLGVGSVDVR